jgi:hypothetical protein
MLYIRICINFWPGSSREGGNWIHVAVSRKKHHDVENNKPLGFAGNFLIS